MKCSTRSLAFLTASLLSLFPCVKASEGTASYIQIFLFSLSTTTTLGIAPAHPASSFSLLVANLQAVVVQMLLVFVTGVVFTRLSQVKLACTL